MGKLLWSGRRNGALPCAAIVFYRSATQSGRYTEFCREQTEKNSQTSYKNHLLNESVVKGVMSFWKSQYFLVFTCNTCVELYIISVNTFSSLLEGILFPNYCASRRGGGGVLERGSTVPNNYFWHSGKYGEYLVVRAFSISDRLSCTRPLNLACRYKAKTYKI